jgi:hypothetical protein
MGEYKVDYDTRARGTSIETCRSEARSSINNMLEALNDIEERNLYDNKIKVTFQVDSATKAKCGVEGDAPASFAVETNFLRELSFTTHHGIHHMFTIKAIAANQDLTLDAHLGVAPSTANLKK